MLDGNVQQKVNVVMVCLVIMQHQIIVHVDVQAKMPQLHVRKEILFIVIPIIVCVQALQMNAKTILNALLEIVL
jgi:hypothetical protein